MEVKIRVFKYYLGALRTMAIYSTWGSIPGNMWGPTKSIQ